MAFWVSPHSHNPEQAFTRLITMNPPASTEQVQLLERSDWGYWFQESLPLRLTSWLLWSIAPFPLFYPAFQKYVFSFLVPPFAEWIGPSYRQFGMFVPDNAQDVE